MTPDLLVQLLALGGVLLVLVVAFAPAIVRRLRRRKQEPAPAPLPVASPAPQDDVCALCQATATRAPANLLPSPWDGWRVRLGLLPRFAIGVEPGATPTLCRTHGRLADALLRARMTAAVQVRLQAAVTDAEAEIAAYLSQGLFDDLRSRLTDEQREALRRRETAAKRAANGGP